MLKFKGILITAGIGLALVSLVYMMLAAERSEHAETKAEYASYRIAAAEASISQAVALQADINQLQEQLDTNVRQQVELQNRLRQAESNRAVERRHADTRIEELKRENEDLARWAATAIPDDWIDFMCEPAGCVAPADPEGDGS